MLRMVRSAGYALLRRRARRLSRQFLAAADDCCATQRDVLRRTLSLNAGSRLHRDNALTGVESTHQFQQRVSIGGYSAAQPYIDDLKRGHTEALLGRRNRLLMFALSSGTTGETKYIPITSRFLADYRRGWLVWGINAFDAVGGMSGLKIFQLSSDFAKLRTPAGTPCGNISGLVQHMQSRFVQYKYCVRPPVLKIADPASKYYTALRLGLAHRDVGVVVTANPSTLVHLAQLADAEKESLIRDIRDGTLSDHCEVDPHIRRQLAPQLSVKRPERARELEAAVKRHGRLWPGDVWPRMKLLAVWTGGSAGAYLSRLRPYYRDVPVRDHGLSASEGRMTIPLQHESSSGVLDVTTHFFEFIPEHQIDDHRPDVLLAHELTEGQCYYILLTTTSGLYRYDIRDVVRCTGFVGTTPMLEFLHKGAHIANITGEKLTESQVVTALSRALQRHSLHIGYYTVTPQWGDPPTYRLLLEHSDLPFPVMADRLADAVDRELMQLNCEYEEKRTTGRLGPLQPTLLPPGTWDRLIAAHQAQPGGSLEQYKHPCLKPDLDFSQHIREFATQAAYAQRKVAS